MAFSRKIPQGKELMSWPPFVFLLVIAAGFLAVSAARIVVRERAIARERRALEVRARELEQERARLEAALRALGSPEAVERAAKERLNLKQSGEEVVVVVPEERPVAAGPPGRSWVENILGPWLGALLRVFPR